MASTVKMNWHDKLPKQLIFWMITLLVPLGIMMLPIGETFTAQIRLFFAITLCVILIVAFETMPILIPSMLLPVIYGLSGLAPFPAVFGPWSSSMPWLFISGMIIANIFNSSGLMRRLTYWCILRVGGSYRGMLYGLGLTGLVTGICIPNIGGRGALYAGVAFGLCKALNLTPKSKEAAGVMLAASVAAIIPAYVYLTDLGMVALNASINFANVPMLSWTQWFIYTGPPLILWMIISLFLVEKLFKVEKPIGSKEFFQKELKEMGKMGFKEKKMAVIMLIVVALLLTTSYHKIDVGWIFLFAACSCYLPGVKLGTEEDLKVNYAMVIFVVATMAIGVVSNMVGAGTFIAAAFYPLVAQTGSVFFIGAIWVVAFLANFILTPLAGISTLVGPLAGIGEMAGINPYVVIFTFMQGIDQVLMPYENVLLIMFMSFGMLALKDFVKYFGIRSMLNLIYVLVVCLPYWMLLGLF